MEAVYWSLDMTLYWDLQDDVVYNTICNVHAQHQSRS